jgi:hypothetical protein
LGAALNALFVLYTVGIVTAGLSIFTALAVLFQISRPGLIGNLVLSSLSSVSLLIASAIVTFVQFKAVDLINTHGNDIGVYAYRGDKYMVLTWLAGAVMFLAMVASAISLFGETLERWRIRRPWMAGFSQLDFKTRQVLT